MQRRKRWSRFGRPIINEQTSADAEYFVGQVKVHLTVTLHWKSQRSLRSVFWMCWTLSWRGETAGDLWLSVLLCVSLWRQVTSATATSARTARTSGARGGNQNRPCPADTTASMASFINISIYTFLHSSAVFTSMYCVVNTVFVL